MQSVALLRACHNPCQLREMTVSTYNGLVNGPVHNLLVQFFTPGRSKIEVFENCFFDIVPTRYDHPRYVKHVLGRVSMFFTLFGYYVRGGGLPRAGHKTCLCSLSPLLKVDSLRGGFAEGNRIVFQLATPWGFYGAEWDER